MWRSIVANQEKLTREGQVRVRDDWSAQSDHEANKMIYQDDMGSAAVPLTWTVHLIFQENSALDTPTADTPTVSLKLILNSLVLVSLCNRNHLKNVMQINSLSKIN
jgi:hypothetical protein